MQSLWAPGTVTTATHGTEATPAGAQQASVDGCMGTTQCPWRHGPLGHRDESAVLLASRSAQLTEGESCARLSRCMRGTPREWFHQLRIHSDLILPQSRD